MKFNVERFTCFLIVTLIIQAGNGCLLTTDYWWVGVISMLVLLPYFVEVGCTWATTKKP